MSLLRLASFIDFVIPEIFSGMVEGINLSLLSLLLPKKKSRHQLED